MKRIVDIPEEMYDWLDNGFPTEDDYVMLWEEIRQGTSLEEELVAELLDLKAEIDIYEAPIYDQPYCRGLKKAMEFIDKRISELKGEQE